MIRSIGNGIKRLLVNSTAAVFQAASDFLVLMGCGMAALFVAGSVLMILLIARSKR